MKPFPGQRLPRTCLLRHETGGTDPKVEIIGGETDQCHYLLMDDPFQGKAVDLQDLVAGLKQRNEG